MRKPNIILITADSLRHDQLGCYSSTPLAATPHLDLFAQESCVYLNAYSVGPNTPHAFPGILAGRNALASGKLGLFEDRLTLAEVLKAVGYTTIAFNAANPYISRHFDYHRGFDLFEDFTDFELDNVTAAGQIIGIPQADLEQYIISEENLRKKEALERSLNQTIVEAIADVQPPFFLWVHFMDTHYPYVPAIDFQRMSSVSNISKESNFQLNRIVRENLTPSPAQLGEIKKLYGACVRQLDARIGNLLAELNLTRKIEGPYIFFCADHGEEFHDHGDFQHKSKLFEELIHVPLIIKRPGTHEAHFVDHPVTLASIPETIMNIVGEQGLFETPGLDGRNETDAITYSAASIAPNGSTPSDANMLNINPIPKVVSVRKDLWKLTYRKNHQPLLFNLFRDPQELHNVAGEEQARTVEMKRMACTLLADLEVRRLSQQLSPIKAQIRTENALQISH